MNTPRIDWKWEVTPQTVISFVSMVGIIGGFLTVVTTVVADIRVAQSQVSDLRSAVQAMTNEIQRLAADNAETRAQVKIILPKVERIEDEVVLQKKSPLGGAPN